MGTRESGRRTENLIRCLGVRQLAASIVNATVGAGIFVIPALAAKQLGAAAPLAYGICAVAMAFIVTTFAMAGSRVGVTGGLFAYVETAFGPYAGFVAGTLQWLTTMLGAAGVSIALLEALAAVAPAWHQPVVRMATLAGVLAGFASVNVRGARNGARVVELLTVAKLLPLLVFVAAGVFAVQRPALAWPGMPDPPSIGRAVLLLVFAFMGIEVALVPSGEIRNPSKTVPRAAYIALLTSTVLYIGIQLVAQGVLGEQLPAHTQAPLVDAARRFLGAGAVLVMAGTLVSMLGFISGDSLCSPRSLYAFGRDGFLPRPFARVHPVFRTPAVAIWTHAAFVFAVASTGTFEAVAIISNVAGLVLYLACCFATLALMRRDVRAGGDPFVPPGARVIVLVSIVAVALILRTATAKEFAATGVVIVIASLLYLARRRADHPPVESALRGPGPGTV